MIFQFKRESWEKWSGVVTASTLESKSHGCSERPQFDLAASQRRDVMWPSCPPPSMPQGPVGRDHCCLLGSELGHVVSYATPRVEGADKKYFGFSKYILKISQSSAFKSLPDCLKGRFFEQRTSGRRARTLWMMGLHLWCEQTPGADSDPPPDSIFIPHLLTTAGHCSNMWWSGGLCQAVTTIHSLSLDWSSSDVIGAAVMSPGCQVTLPVRSHLNKVDLSSTTDRARLGLCFYDINFDIN